MTNQQIKSASENVLIGSATFEDAAAKLTGMFKNAQGRGWEKTSGCSLLFHPGEPGKQDYLQVSGANPTKVNIVDGDNW